MNWDKLIEKVKDFENVYVAPHKQSVVLSDTLLYTDDDGIDCFQTGLFFGINGEVRFCYDGQKPQKFIENRTPDQMYQIIKMITDKE